ncbi:MAG: hypothetical protein ACLFT3_03220 [Cyclobacteriaceae bacterium]
MKHVFFILMMIFLFFSCEEEEIVDEQVFDEAFTFEESMAGWEGDFADYPIGEDEFFELNYDREPLPAPLDQDRYGLVLSGSNRSDDFSFLPAPQFWNHLS